MQSGTKISGAAHIALVGVAVFGGAFKSEPLPFEVREVSVISAEQFAAMTSQPATPDVAVDPAALPSPDPDTDTPEVAVQSDSAPDQALPEPTPPPEPVSEPEVVPVPEPPQPEEVIEPQDQSEQEQINPVDRVAPVPVDTPPDDTTPDEDVTPQVTPDEGAETPQEPSEATAPEAANDRIITEADDTSALAPTSSPRPRARPQRRAAVAQEPEPDTSRNAIDQALAAEAQTADQAATPTPAPTGPPLTGGEKDVLRVAVSKCWNVGSLSSEALQTTVVVSVSMTPDGKPVNSSIRMLSSSGGSDANARRAYETARRAIIRCGSSGFDLPSEKYSQWQEIEMTFNPERMRIR